MKSQNVKIGNIYVGSGHPCFITLEAGPTHSGLDSAKLLARTAAAEGANAIKFQILDPDRLVEDKELLFSYDILVNRASGETVTVTEPLYDILSRRCMARKDWESLKKYCDEIGISFFCTVMFDEDIDFAVSIGCDSLKIASGDINHFPLIRKAAQTGLCVQIDTGNGTIGEIENAVKIILDENNDQIIIHHCPSGYPTTAEGVNLNVLRSLRQLFPFPVAFSDHSPGWEMDIAAVALGVNMIEKTITLDRLTPSVEHIMSLEPEEVRLFIKSIRDLEKAFGKSRRIMNDEELNKRRAIRRSIYLKVPVIAGQAVDTALFEFRRPGYGLGPDRVDEIKHMVFRHDLPCGHLLSMDDIASIAD